MTGLLRPTDLKEISAEAEVAKMEEERAHKRKKDKHAAELREAFLARDVLPDAADRVNNAVRIAAEQGLHQIEVVTFPVKYCNDGGRSINNFDPDWPKSLEGYAKKAYDSTRESCARSATRCTPRSSAIPTASLAKQLCTSSGEP